MFQNRGRLRWEAREKGSKEQRGRGGEKCSHDNLAAFRLRGTCRSVPFSSLRSNMSRDAGGVCGMRGVEWAVLTALHAFSCVSTCLREEPV